MRRALVLSLIVLAWGATASAQAQGKPRRRPPPTPALVTPPPAPPVTFKPARAVSASLPDVGPTCRAQCSKDRYSCHGEDDLTDCDGRWLTCLSACRAR